MDFPVSPSQQGLFPWRTAAMVALAVAAVELVLLLATGSALLIEANGPTASQARKAAPATETKAETTRKTTTPAKPARTGAPGLPRRLVSVVILNGNGRTGAAAAAASRVEARGYRIGLVGNAPSHDYPRSLVMYRPGFAAEGKRLARDLGIGLVSPLDGMRTGQLDGAHTVLILGG